MAKLERITRDCMKPLMEPYGLCEAVRHGDTLTIAGTTGIDERQQVVEGGLKAQALQAFRNIRAILEAAGASQANLVHLTWYLADSPTAFLEDAFAVTAARDEIFPALTCGNTAVRVKALLTPELLIEVNGTAAL
jgi:2-iminobutanoate/2-iminopropanoate deaminase